MNEMNRGGDAADETGTTREVDQGWSQLAQSLADHLGRMTSEEDHLVLELPPGHDGGATPYAQFAGFGNGHMLRAELSGDVYLPPASRLGAEWCDALLTMGWMGNDDEEPNWYVERPLGDAKVVAGLVVGALREAYGVAHPLLLTYHAWGPAAAGAAGLGLSATEDVPAELPAAPDGPVAFMSSERDELVEWVGMTLESKYGERPAIDSDGDFVLAHLDQPVWVRVRPDTPGVEIFARVAHSIHSRRATASELAVLNRDHPWVKWTLEERTVWQRIVIPALPFAPTHLEAMVDVFLATMTATRDDLAFRVGGRVA
ncbi:T3SS (YopN, CesT) and YbjN peptide-binding chaperone 1 [Nocardioides sp. P5_E3]